MGNRRGDWLEGAGDSALYGPRTEVAAVDVLQRYIEHYLSYALVSSYFAGGGKSGCLAEKHGQ